LTTNERQHVARIDAMRSGALRIGWYWFRATLRRRWGAYLAVVLLVGSVGGLAVGSIGAAQRTRSSFNVFLASTNPSDFTITLEAPNVTAVLSRLPLVRHVALASYSVNAFPAGHDGAPSFANALDNGSVTNVGSMNGEYFTVDKATVVAGRMANPRRADEFVMQAAAERAMGWHVGETIPMYFYTDAQTEQSDFGKSKVKPTVSLDMHLVGTVVPNDDVLLDEVDQKPSLMIFTPALTHQLVNNAVHYNIYALQLDHGTRDISAVEREIIAKLPRGTTYSFHVNSVIGAEVNRSVYPESIALGVFGLIAGLAALIIAASLIARALQNERDDLEIMRALGASPSANATAGLFGLVGAVVLGAVLACVVAVVLSPLSPIGPVRPVYPYRGLNFEWSVLGLGFAVLLVALGVITVVIARRVLGHRTRGTRETALGFGSRVGRFAAELGLPVTAVVGVRFALEPGRDRDAVPLRSALVGSVLALAIVVATLTFGASLSTLVSRPALFGWNWSYALYANGNGVPPQAERLLASDPYVEAYSGVKFADVQIDGVTVPSDVMRNYAKVTAPILAGHEVDGAGQIVLGAETMKQLHKHLGQTVTASYGAKQDAPVYVPPTTLTIVGTATFPAVGGVLSEHTSMGVGAVVPLGVIPRAFLKFLHSPYEALNGPSMVDVRLKDSAPRALALASLKKIARLGTRELDATPEGGGSSILVLSVPYPAEIENYRTMGATPDLLALALAAGAVVALGLTLVASVNRRRRDLALLRTLGFTGRQLLSAVAWQASVAAAVGIVIGIPIGVVTGQWLWTLFARDIYAVPEPSVPVVSVLIVALAALVLANVVAALPGRSAARTSTAQVLRGE
jgi:ABC-type lipoprotein release transport system permease subunit